MIGLERHIVQFDPSTFDLQATARRLCQLPADQRRYVAELVQEQCDANNVFDLEVARFLVNVILALALVPNENTDLVIPSTLEMSGQHRDFPAALP